MVDISVHPFRLRCLTTLAGVRLVFAQFDARGAQLRLVPCFGSNGHQQVSHFINCLRDAGSV